jgi:hypothetical protein
VRINETAGNSFCDSCPKDERRNKVEERCPDNCKSRGQNARGNDGGDAIGGIMKAVDEVEGKSDQNGDCNQQSAQVHLARLPFIHVAFAPKNRFKTFFVIQIFQP